MIVTVRALADPDRTEIEPACLTQFALLIGHAGQRRQVGGDHWMAATQDLCAQTNGLARRALTFGRTTRRVREAAEIVMHARPEWPRSTPGSARVQAVTRAIPFAAV